MDDSAELERLREQTSALVRYLKASPPKLDAALAVITEIELAGAGR